MTDPVEPTEAAELAEPVESAEPAGRPAPPRLTPALTGANHLLLLADDVGWQELDALVRSSVAGADWRAQPRPELPGVLDLLAGEHADLTARGEDLPRLADGTVERATLTGPWRVDIVNRRELGLPAWVSTAFVVDVAPERSTPVEQLPQGYGELLDAFGVEHPVGLERQVLDVLLATARRLAGAVRTGDGVVVEPDPASAVDITLHSPTWLSPSAAAAVLTPHLPGLVLLRGVDVETASSLDGYGADWRLPPVAGDDDAPPSLLTLHVEAAEVIPAALADATWTEGGVISYRLAWVADPADRAGATPEARERRELAHRAITAAAVALHAAAGGELLDEDEFLLDPTDLGLARHHGEGQGSSSSRTP